MSIQLLAPADIQALITGVQYTGITVPRRQQLAGLLQAARSELAQVLPELMSRAQSDAETAFLRALVVTVTAPPPAGVPTPGTLAFRGDLSALTGGGAGALDGLDTTGLATGAVVEIVIGGVEMHYQLRPADGAGYPDGPYVAAANSTGVIQPFSFNSATNARVWVEMQ